MAYTTHGHHIPFTFLGDDTPGSAEECGGVRLCRPCTLEALPHTPAFRDTPIHMIYNTRSSVDFIERAKRLVFEYVRDHLDRTDLFLTFSEKDVYVVWFNKTLGNWKALISTTLPDGMYYEVTHDGDKGETYLDAYKKFHNVTVAC